jgi:hypothetical protein
MSVIIRLVKEGRMRPAQINTQLQYLKKSSNVI